MTSGQADGAPRVEPEGASTSGTHAPGGVHAEWALPKGTRLQEFELTDVLGVGGFGIVYRALDHNFEVERAIKEYMPSSMATRRGDGSVAVKSPDQAGTFMAGMRSFLKEARVLAHFDHPSLVKVFRYFEHNGTAYMAMPVYRGITLKESLASLGRPPEEAWLRNIFDGVLAALEIIHAQQCYHRDIAPDNIFLLEDGRPLLLDFGAARQIIGDMTQDLHVILKPGYAPFEQYSNDDSVPQGPWTDLYALGAVMYTAIMGKAPVPAINRVVADTLGKVQEAARGRYRPGFLELVDDLLAVMPKDRPQSVNAIRKRLADLDAPSAPQADDTPTIIVPPRPRPVERASERPRAPDAVEADDDGGSMWLRYGVPAAGVVAVLAGLAWWQFRSRPEPPVPVAANAESRPAGASEPGTNARLPAAPKVAAGASESPDTPAARDDRPAPGPVDRQPEPVRTAPPPPAAAPAAAPIRADLPAGLLALKSLYERRAADHGVKVTVANPRLAIGSSTPYRFTVTSSRGGYVYIIFSDQKGEDLYMLYPNPTSGGGGANRIRPNVPLVLPPVNGPVLTAKGPPGKYPYVAVVTDQPRNPAVLNLDAAGNIYAIPRAVVKGMLESGHPGALAGSAKCPAGENDCVDVFGAEQFAFEEYT